MYASTSKALNYEASVAAVEQFTKLESLVAQYSRKNDKILADPELRTGLTRVASALNIDPFHLPSASKQERHNRIATVSIEICRALQSQTGGSLPLAQLTERVSKELVTRVSEQEVTEAIADLKLFGPGLSVEDLPNGSKVIRNTAEELSSDQGTVLAACDALGFVTEDMLQDNLGWDASRARDIVNSMVSVGLLWVDLQCAPTQYWVPYG